MRLTKNFPSPKLTEKAWPSWIFKFLTRNSKKSVNFWPFELTDFFPNQSFLDSPVNLVIVSEIISECTHPRIEENSQPTAVSSFVCLLLYEYVRCVYTRFPRSFLHEFTINNVKKYFIISFFDLVTLKFDYAEVFKAKQLIFGHVVNKRLLLKL